MDDNSIPMKNTQAPGFYRFRLGVYEVNALFDSMLECPAAIFKGFTTLGEREIDELLDLDFTPRSVGGMCDVVLNAYLVNTGNHLVLIDAGIGETDSSVFVDARGHLTENLKAAGYAPEQVDIILPTHLHFDHICGIVANGEMAFPNAEVHLAKEERDFWLGTPLDEFPAALREYALLARKALEPYEKAGRIRIYRSGEVLFDNIKSVPLFGHTPGQTGFLFAAEDKELLVSGDFIHIKSVQLIHPEIGDVFDIDARAAGETRVRVLPAIAERRMLLAACHFPFPGVGHIGKTDEGYRWHPIEYSLPRQ